ncbi:transposase [Nonomuraea sp. CA-143628]|uniref:transposase n=1 Tax=Nonomuraea sp. CA-143628 TaxID=3239997 RepID=UPI003D8BC947
MGGDCPADIAPLRAQPGLLGPVASDPTGSRLINRLARDEAKALKALRAAREHAWDLAGTRAEGTDGGLIPLDLDATIVIAHSDKEHASPTWKHTFGFHPMTVFADHGPRGSGEPLAIVLRPGNAGSNTAADHIEATRLALAQFPKHHRRQVLIRTDSGGGTQEFLTWLTKPGRRLSHSIGFTLTEEIQQAVLRLPTSVDPRLRRRPASAARRLRGRADRPGQPAAPPLRPTDAPRTATAGPGGAGPRGLLQMRHERIRRVSPAAERTVGPACLQSDVPCVGPRAPVDADRAHGGRYHPRPGAVRGR